MKVNRAVHSNTYCGPAALSLLTGQHVDICTHLLKKFRNSTRPVAGVYNREVFNVLDYFGFIATPLPPCTGAGQTVAGFLRNLQDREPDAMYLINTTHHYLVLRGRKLFDNHHPEGIFIRQYPHRRSRVCSAWRVWQRPHWPPP
jgi:hypothetical protein